MGVCHFGVDSGTFLCDIGTLMWLSGTLMLAFRTVFFCSKRSSLVLSRRFMAE